MFLKCLFTCSYVIWIILLSFEYHLKTLYWCFWYFKKRRGDSFSSEVAFILQMAYNKVFEFSAEVRGYHYYRFWIPQKIKSLNAFLKLITHLIALQSKYAKLEMKMQLAIFLEKYHAFRNFSWIGEPLSVFNFNQWTLSSISYCSGWDGNYLQNHNEDTWYM